MLDTRCAPFLLRPLPLGSPILPKALTKALPARLRSVNYAGILIKNAVKVKAYYSNMHLLEHVLSASFSVLCLLLHVL